jgi:hypothetical protein
MKSDKSKKVNPDKYSEFIKPKKKLGSGKNEKVSLKSSKFWEKNVDDDEDSLSNYKIKGM